MVQVRLHVQHLDGHIAMPVASVSHTGHITNMCYLKPLFSDVPTMAKLRHHLVYMTTM